MFLLRPAKTDKHGREHGEHIRLDVCHQQLQKVHEHHKEQRKRCHGSSDCRSHLGGYEYYAGKRQYDGVTCGDICEQTYGKGERLGEYTYNLDEREQRYGSLEEYGDIGPENLLPVLAVTEYIHGKECDQGKEECHGYVAGHIGSCREYGNESHDVAQQYKEEYGEQQRGVPFVILAYRGFDHVIDYHGNDKLHEAHKALGRGIGGAVTSVPACGAHHNDAEQQAVEDHSQSNLGERQVKRLEFSTIRKGLHQLTGICTILSYMESLIAALMTELIGHKEMPARHLAVEHHRQMKAYLLIAECNYVPVIGVLEVTEYDALDIDSLLIGLSLLGPCRHNRHQQQQ